MTSADARVLGFAGFRRSVTHLARSVAFYRDGLGFLPDSGQGDRRRPAPMPTVLRTMRLRLGAQAIDLIEDPQAAWSRSAAGSVDTGFQHIAIVASDLAAAHARLMACAPRALTRGGVPVRLPDSAGGVTAFKCLDPDGHPLELIQFPPGTGNALWQQPATADGPTLGIDHSAIVVTDVVRSIAFYRDRLGFTVAAHQVNQGPAQDQLDGLDGAIVDVVALRPAREGTPHLELLAYRVPAPRPSPSRPWADQLMWWADAGHDGADRDSQPAACSAVEIHDPDGHAHLLHRPASG